MSCRALEFRDLGLGLGDLDGNIGYHSIPK